MKINWKELGKQLWEAVKPVLLAAIGGGNRIARRQSDVVHEFVAE